MLSPAPDCKSHRSAGLWFIWRTFLSSPLEVVQGLCKAVDVSWEPALERKLQELLSKPINTLSAPADEKWRSQNRQEISDLLPRIAALAPLAGYQVDPVSGHYTIVRP